MKYTTTENLYIKERDNSPSKYCKTGTYYKIDPNKLNFHDWKEKSLKLDPSVDFTYWEFDIKISKGLRGEYLKADRKFTQDKYIITNRRIVHVFNNDPYYHTNALTGVYRREPENVVELLKGLFMPDTIKFIKSKGRGPISYGLKNNTNKVQSFLNVQDNKYLKIQTSYLKESINLIEGLERVYSSNIKAFEKEVVLNEAHLEPLQEKYLLIEKFLYTYNPNVIALGNSVRDYDGIRSLSLDEEQVPILLQHSEFVVEELGCDYLIDNNDLILTLK